jgi:Holliday junction resolvase RusA-like endonuclease
MIKFEVRGNPVPKPRMTRRDKWLKRPIVERYWEYSTRLQQAYVKEINKLGMGVRQAVITLGVRFFIVGSLNVCDIDNCMKGITDALVRIGAVENDTMKYVRGYRYVDVVWVCETCGSMNKCNKVKICDRGKTEILIGGV